MHAWQVVKTVLCGLTVTLLLTAFTSSEECGTRFIDFTSSVVLAEVVIQGVAREFKAIPAAPGLYSATISVSGIYKGMEVLKTAQRMDAQGTVEVLFFGSENKDSCVASAGDDLEGQEMVYFLRPSSDNTGTMEHSALPVTVEGDEEAKVERSLCDTCIRPPVIARIVCKECAHEPTIKPLRSRKATLGRRARLRCSSRGNPRPRIEWFKGQVPIADGNAGLTITTSSSSSTLIFSSVTLAHAGQYTCIATNEVGVANGVVSLEVTRKPKQTRKPPSHRSVKDSPDKVVCQANPCNNGGTCYFSPSLNLRQCACQSGFEGVTCENAISSAVNAQRPFSSVTTNERSPTSSSVVVNNSTTDAPASRHGDETEFEISSKSDKYNSNDDARMHQMEKEMAMNLTKTTITDNAMKENASAEFAEVAPTMPKSPQTVQGDRISTPITPPVYTSPTTSASTSLKPIHAPSSNGTKKPDNRKTSLKIVQCEDKSYCLNNGRCKYIRQLNKKYCQCGQGHGGKRCEIRLNLQKHSSKGGEELAIAAKTTKISGQSSKYENGTRIVACKSNPCLHGGTCYFDPSLNSETCLCSLGFKGTHCSTKTYFKSSYKSKTLKRNVAVNTTKEISTQVARLHNVTTPLPIMNKITPQVSNRSKNIFENVTKLLEFEATTQTSTTHSTSDNKTFDFVKKSNKTPKKRITPDKVTAAVITSSLPSSSNQSSSIVKKSKHRNIAGGERLAGFPIKRKNSLKIIPCREKHYCNHGGKCRFIRKLNLKYCQCRKGYGGKRCEVTLNFG